MEIPHWVYTTMKGYCRMQLKEKVQEKQEWEMNNDDTNNNFWNTNCPDRFDDNTMKAINKMTNDEEILWTSNEEVLQESKEDFLERENQVVKPRVT